MAHVNSWDIKRATEYKSYQTIRNDMVEGMDIAGVGAHYVNAFRIAEQYAYAEAFGLDYRSHRWINLYCQYHMEAC